MQRTLRRPGRARGVREQIRRLASRPRSGGSVPGCAVDELGPRARLPVPLDHRVARAVSSRIARMSRRFPRRSDQSAQITTFACESSSREAIAGAAKPEKIGTCTAPTCAHACDATATAGHIGMKIATRSPSSTPSSTSASASCVTCRDASAHVSDSRVPSSYSPTSASSVGRRPAVDADAGDVHAAARRTTSPTRGRARRRRTASHGVRELDPEVLDHGRPEPVRLLDGESVQLAGSPQRRAGARAGSRSPARRARACGPQTKPPPRLEPTLRR